MAVKLNYEEIEEVVLQLSPEEMEKLARSLHARMGEPVDTEIEKEWIAEAEKRLDEILSGEVEAVDGEEAMRRVRATIHEKI